MSDSISEADKIRSKRLAKLGSQGPSASKSETSEDQKPSDSREAPRPAINIRTVANDTSRADANPFLKLGLKPQGSEASSPAPPTRTTLESTKRPRREDSPEAWEDKAISGIFRVTLNPNTTQDAHGSTLYHVSSVRAELDEQDAPLRFSTVLLDQTILEAATGQAGSDPLEYLLACWKRVSRQFRHLRGTNQEDHKYKTIREIRRLCMSYCIFAATMPEMFEVETPSKSPLAKHLLADPESDGGLCIDFLTEAVARFPDDDSIRDAFVQAAEELSQDLSQLTMNDDYKAYIHGFRNLIRYVPLVEAISRSPLFLPEGIAPQDIESKTLLGPFFRLSPIQEPVASNYFSSPKTRDRQYILNSQNALRLTLKTHQDELFDIVNSLIKASKESREKTLDWFARIVNLNHKRRAMQTDARYVSADGFMVNVTTCLDQLCEPFIDATFSKIHRIEVEYLRRSPRVEIGDETKINADQATSDVFYQKKIEGENNFISELFFLTVAAHHYGTEGVNSKMGSLQRQIRHFDSEIERFEEERKKHLNDPLNLPRWDEALRRLKARAEAFHCTYLAIEAVLLDELAQARSMQFMRYVIVWLMRLASGSTVDFPKQPLTLPLPQDQPELFKCLPEYFIEDIVDSFKFITGHLPQVITSTQCQELVMVCITFLTSSEYIKNPYLKSGLVTILYHGVLPARTRANGVLGDTLNALPFANQYLLHSLLKFYIECEATGMHTQFYDKFRIRYEIFQVLRCIWSNTVYRQRLATEAQHNLEFFVRFVNLLLNDVTFVLDESFTAFHKIHDLQKEVRNPGFAALEEAVRKDKEEALEDAQNKAKSYMSLTTETLAMLKLFTESLADAFTTPEVVQRLADMLDYNLDALVGPKQSNLKVENPAQYSFDPKALLSDILDVFLNLGSKPSFQLAVARDGRSYKASNFTQAASILSRWGLKSPEDLTRWANLSEIIAKTKEADDAAEEDLGEVPDEFLDPLMATLMEDPVILPLSKAVMDRSTIRSHLLSDPTDPYNRSPLNIEDVIPDTELKARIDAFRREHRGKKMIGAVDGVDQMDVEAPDTAP